MNELLAGLFGSVITVIATKVLEIIQKNEEHKNSLKRAFFEKKLNAAEAASIQFMQISVNIGGLATLYDIFVKEKSFNVEVFQKLNQSYFNKLSEVESNTANIAHSIYIYFDISLELTSHNQLFKNVFIKLSEIKQLDIPMQIYLDMHNKSKGTPQEEMYSKLLEETANKFPSRILELSESFKKIECVMQDLITNMRNELKKYS